MKFINYQMVIWLIIQLLIIISTKPSTNSDSNVVFWCTLPFLILNCIAIVTILLGKPKTGSIIFLVGSIPFVPIGLIGVVGARKITNQIKKDQFFKTLNS
ncbi:hypothetical protein [Aquimarina sp. SS2-1]|uniref:hypothetical protein n=1 Tax=Aquimarina besae TaxID=3342247 RepID=UPI00366B05E8